MKGKDTRLQKRQRNDGALPSDDRIASLSRLIQEKIHKEETIRKYAPVKHVLSLVGAGVVIGLSFVAPAAAGVFKPFLDEEERKEKNAWKQYNPYFLKRTLARLQAQKLVEITQQDGEQVVTLTKNGRRRILKYALDDLSIPRPKSWDGKWRLVLYDVDNRRKQLRDIFRESLRGLGFYRLQESVWLHPYPCEDQVTFLREYHGVGAEVLYVVATKLEDDAPYRTYFDLD